MLKKRGEDAPMQIKSCVGPQLAGSALTRWNELDARAKTQQIKSLGRVLQTSGLTPRDMRAVGAHLYTRQQTLESPHRTEGAARLAAAAALRHAPPAKTSIDHYSRVRDSGPKLAAQIAELPDSARQELEALLQRFGVQN
jgi:hypothetical protein